MYICGTQKEIKDMATAKTTTNRNYNEVNHYLGISNELEMGSKEWYQAIKKAINKKKYENSL